MRAFFPNIVGNEALCRRIGYDITHGKLSHAYIIEGPYGSGKRTMALEISAAIACEHRHDENYPLPCGVCPTCRKIREGLCPDVIRVTREEDHTTMGVEVIRDIRTQIAVVPNDLDIKIYVVEDAHTMTSQAQNALLRTLEDPPTAVLFLLLAEDATALLETVLSRAPVLHMQAIGEDDLRTHLQKHASARALDRDRPEEFRELLLLSGGSIGVATELLDSKTRAPLMERRRFATRTAELLAERGKNDELLLLLFNRPTSRESLLADLSTLECALRDLLLLDRAESVPLLFFVDRETATELSADFTTNRLLAILSAIGEAKRAIFQNANVKLTLSHLVSKMTQR